MAPRLRTRVAVQVRVALADPVTLGLLGSVLVAVGSLGIGITPKPDPIAHLPGLGLLRSTLPGQALATGSIIAGIAVLLTAWLALGRDLRAGTGPGVAGLRRALWLWAWPLLLTPPLFSRDAYSYAAQGNLVRHGYDVYEVGPWVIPGPFADSVDPIWATTPAPYGPLFLALAGGVSRLTGDSVYLGVLGMRALALLGVWLLLRYLPRLAACCRVDPAGALWLGVVNPLTLLHFVAGAHNDALMIALLVAGLTLAMEAVTSAHPGRGLVAGAAVLALAAGVKAPAAVLLGFVGHLWARRLDGPHRLVGGFARAGAVGLAVFTALTLLTGVGWGWVGALDTPGTVLTWLSPPTALGMLVGGGAELLGAKDTLWPVIDAVRAASGLLAVALVAALLLRPRTVHPVRGAAAALFLVVVLGPVVQPWYLMWALVPYVAAGVRSAREGALVTWGVIGTLTVSQLNGSTMIGPFALPGSLAALLAAGYVVRGARTAEHAAVGTSGGTVFDLAMLRPAPVVLPEARSRPSELVGTSPAAGTSPAR